jgi:hypothetical protein
MLVAATLATNHPRSKAMPAAYSKLRCFIRCGSLLLVSGLLLSAHTSPSSAADNDNDAVATVPAETTPIAPPGLKTNDEAEVAAVVEIWKKVRGKDAPAVDAGEFANALHALLAKDAERRRGSTSINPGDCPNTFENKLADQKFADEPTIAPAATEPNKKDKLTSLRETARKLDTMAEELDELELYEQADGLRQQAQTIRAQWRQLRSPQHTVVPGTPVYGGPGPTY